MAEPRDPEPAALAAVAAQFGDIIERLERCTVQDRAAGRELEREVAVLAQELMRFEETPERRVLIGIARDLTANLWALRDGLPAVAEADELRERLATLLPPKEP